VKVEEVGKEAVSIVEVRRTWNENFYTVIRK